MFLCLFSDSCNEISGGCEADMNGDGGWNVLDIVSLANCVLADSCGGWVDDASVMYFFMVEAAGNVNV